MVHQHASVQWQPDSSRKSAPHRARSQCLPRYAPCCDQRHSALGIRIPAARSLSHNASRILPGCDLSRVFLACFAIAFSTFCSISSRNIPIFFHCKSFDIIASQPLQDSRFRGCLLFACLCAENFRQCHPLIACIASRVVLPRYTPSSHQPPRASPWRFSCLLNSAPRSRKSVSRATSAGLVV